jgi:hypothetical protein
MKFEVKNIKNNGVTALTVTGGVIAANAVTKLVPIDNPMIKSLIPLAVGTASLGLDNKHLVNIGIGMACFGVLSLANTLVRGAIPTADGEVMNGLGNIGDNPMVSKIADILLPNLGNVGNAPTEIYQPISDFYEVEDASYNDLGLEDALNGFDDDMAFESLAGDEMFESLNGMSPDFY